MLRLRGLTKIQTRCLTTQWYYATDIPSTRPHEPHYTPDSEPQSFQKLTESDSMKLETQYTSNLTSAGKDDYKKLVQVGEDRLFSVDLDKFTIKPTFWEGPTYEVRRGMWFNSNGSPLSVELCLELEAISTIKDEIQKLKGTYPEGKFALFTDTEQNTGFILNNLDGGKLFLNYLKSGLSNYLPINGTKVYKGKKKPSNLGELEKVLVDNTKFEYPSSATSGITTGKESEGGQLEESYLSNLTNWEIFDELPTFLNGNSKTKSKKESTSTYDVFDDQVKNPDSKGHNVRKIHDLVLCVHGIGQTLGKKYEYVNFAHTVNLLRTNIKRLYSESEQLKNLNKSTGFSDWKDNSGVQVLPITWRHAVNFQTESSEDNIENPELPSLANISINGVLPLRKLIGDVALDVLLYQESYYQKMILDEVARQLNAVYTSFLKQNPDFDGRVHLIGHSLGSLILFEMLSQHRLYKLKFDVDNFFSIGSPIGILKLVQRTKIGPKKGPKPKSALKVNRPNCKEMYNIYHSCDPVAYRIEPLVDPEMANFEQLYLPHWSELDGFTSKMIEMTGNLWDGLPMPDTQDKEKVKEGIRKETIQNIKNVERIVDKTHKNNTFKITGELKTILTELNHKGRLDYSLKPNLLEVDVISAIKSHVSYFEEPDIAGFLLREILKKHEKVQDIIVKKVNEKSN